MKIQASYSGPDGRTDWKFEMEYEDLPPEYVLEIASTARAFLNFVKNLAGGAASSDRAYTFEFNYKADDKAPKAAGEYDELLKGSVKAANLLYSQVVEAQKAGIELQTRLLQGAEMEIKSGQRE